MQNEIWKDIPNYQGLYQASNQGRIKSLDRKVKSKNNSFAIKRSKILKPKIDKDGYENVVLQKEGKRQDFRVHRLILMTFDKIDNRQVDHINQIKNDNRLINLRYCTQRQNNSWNKDKSKTTSKFTGVSWCKKSKKWRAQIQEKNKTFHLGFFDIEEHAHDAYIMFIEDNINNTLPYI